MKRLFLIPVLILVIIMSLGALILGSCTSSTPTATGPIKIGHIVNLTGPEAMVGEQEEKSLQYAFDSVGNQVEGRPIEVIVGDAGGQTATSVDVARKMVEQDKVVVIFGPTEIGQKFAVAGYCKQAGIPLILYNPSPPDIFTDNKWVIGSGGTTPQCGSCMGDYIANQLHYKTITTLTEDNSAGRAFMDPLTDYFTKAGGTVVQQQWVAEETTDFAPYLTAMKNADALAAWEPGGAGIALLTQWHQLGIDKRLPIVAPFHGGFLDPFIPMSMAPADAAAVVGSLAAMTYDPGSQDPVNQEFVKGFTTLMGFPPGDDGVSGPCTSAILFMAAVKAAGGDTTPDKLLEALMTVSIVGPEGPESITPGQQAATKNVYILKVDRVPNTDIYHYTAIFTYKDVPPTGYTGK